ncbi:hypothetical protein [Phreatobacter sp.]|uniref:hypothetical protein n=1 Tax=Phreatobacter sp. TaxID=1966341 RepID=UPI0025E8C800|nr:hypothetical protein [Phreatobacter sp.]
MTDDVKRKRGRPRKTLDEARAKLAPGKSRLTRAEQKLLQETGEIERRSAGRYPTEIGVDYAVRVAAEWEAQLVRAGHSPEDARREAARLASDDLTLRQEREAEAENTAAKPNGGRSFIPVQTIWETDLATGQMRPVSLAENARDCGHEAPEPLSDRAKDGGHQRGRSRMEKIARRLASNNGAQAREASVRTAELGTLGDEMQTAGQAQKVTLARIQVGRKPKSGARIKD